MPNKSGPRSWARISRSKRVSKLLLYRHLRLARLYLAASLAVLLISTVFWATLSAKLQNANADQLVNAYLFADRHGLRDVFLPSTHNFLIKWPLLAAIKLFGISSATLISFTVGLTLATVVLFALVLYFIERRPIVIGTIYLALASALLLVPAVPAAGNLLPVNMAMLATRNVEYVVFIASLMAIIRRASFRDPIFWLGVIGLVLLAASDKLFLYISLGGGLLSLLAYGLSRGWYLVKLSARWVAASILAAGGSVALSSFINKHLVYLSSQTVGPYNIIHSLHELLLGSFYGVCGIFTNFGANPAFDTTLIGQMPGRLLHNLFVYGGVVFLVNLSILVLAVLAALHFLNRSLLHNKKKSAVISQSAKLAVAMMWAALAAGVLFVGSRHYYAGDARYLGICLFSGFIALAAYTRERNFQSRHLVIFGEVAILGILLALPATVRTYHQDNQTLQPLKQRNSVVASALDSHKVDYLVGDYWRVIPLKFANPKTKEQIAPLANCTQLRPDLTSGEWRPDLSKHSFAYLLSYDRSQTDYPSCSLSQIVKAYGRPNSSLVLEGDLAHPIESLLFYDHGISKSSPLTTAPAQGTSTVVPETLSQLPYTACAAPTIMNIVAHQDDDLLFMNPDLVHDIQAGHCVRTVYVTAGDAGSNRFYWLSRQQGSEAAYSKMIGTSNIWVERLLKLADNEFATVANPRGNPNISLIFLYLPDGNLRGQGFPATHHQSLARLYDNKLGTINAIYSGSAYTSTQLKNVLTSLMQTYQPSEIRTQSDYPGYAFPDHSDHRSAGRFALEAYNVYIQQRFDGRPDVPIKFYLGYSGYEQPANVSGADLNLKAAIFQDYAKYDSGAGACINLAHCFRDPAYGAYLTRQYQNDY